MSFQFMKKKSCWPKYCLSWLINGYDIGSGSLTDCPLSSFSDHRRHTQQCRAAPQAKIETNATGTDVITH